MILLGDVKSFQFAYSVNSFESSFKKKVFPRKLPYTFLFLFASFCTCFSSGLNVEYSSSGQILCGIISNYIFLPYQNVILATQAID